MGPAGAREPFRDPRLFSRRRWNALILGEITENVAKRAASFSITAIERLPWINSASTTDGNI
jgi:hypothetical protein